MKNDIKVALGARAESNGVVIYDNDFERRKIGYMAAISGIGELYSKRITYNFTEYQQIKISKQMPVMLLSLWFITLILVLSIKPEINIFKILISIGLFIAYVWSDMVWILKIFFKTRFQKDSNYIAQSKFHAAAHKVLNAYEAYHRLPTVEESQRESIFSATCDSLDFLTKPIFVTSILITFIVGNDRIVQSFILFAIVFSFITIRKCKFFQKLEKIILLDPSEKEIECAIEALKQYELYQYGRN